MILLDVISCKNDSERSQPNTHRGCEEFNVEEALFMLFKFKLI